MDKLRDYMDFWRASLTASAQEEERLDNAITLLQQAEEEQNKREDRDARIIVNMNADRLKAVNQLNDLMLRHEALMAKVRLWGNRLYELGVTDDAYDIAMGMIEETNE